MLQWIVKTYMLVPTTMMTTRVFEILSLAESTHFYFHFQMLSVTTNNYALTCNRVLRHLTETASQMPWYARSGRACSTSQFGFS